MTGPREIPISEFKGRRYKIVPEKTGYIVWVEDPPGNMRGKQWFKKVYRTEADAEKAAERVRRTQGYSAKVAPYVPPARVADFDKHERLPRLKLDLTLTKVEPVVRRVRVAEDRALKKETGK